MGKISAVICTFNEEQHIVDCLEALSWVDEIIVVDDGSTDRTVELAKQHTDKVFHHQGVGYVEPTRNFAIGKASHDWVLLVDADERIPDTLATELRRLAESNILQTHVLIPRKNIIFKSWIKHTGWWPDTLVRFFKKGTVLWSDDIHSVPSTTGDALALPITEEMALVHYNYSSIQQFLLKHMKYALFEADKLTKSGYVFHSSDLLRKPLADFLSRYFAQEGYKDGLHGLILSILMGWYVFITYLYLWEKKNFQPESPPKVLALVESEQQSFTKDVRYWLRTVHLHDIHNPVIKTFKKVIRKIGK